MSAPTSLERDGWRAFVVAIAVACLTILDISKVNVAVPAIEAGLGADPTAIQLTVTGYTLTFGLALVPAGRYGDLHSRRRMFLIGLVVFTLASLACAFAIAPWMLGVARLVQGLAAGILMPQVLGITQQLFTGPARGRAFGVFGAVVSLSIALGPTLGGALIGLAGPDLGWRLIFLINVPLVAVLFPLAALWLPRTQAQASATRDLDPIGILLLAVTTVTLMVPFVLTTGGEDDDPRRWWSIAAAVVAGVAFVLWERRYSRQGRVPVVDFGLFRDPGYRNAVVLGLFWFAAIPGTFLTTTLFIQNGLGFPAIVAGVTSVPFALASAASSWWAGGRVLRWGRWIVVLGVALGFVGFGGLLLTGLLLPTEVAPIGMGAALAVAGLGGGMVVSPNQTLMLHDVPVVKGGLAGSIGQLAQRVGTAIGIAFCASAFYATLTHEAALAPTVAYHDAYRNSVLVTLALVVITLAVGLVDVVGRRMKRTDLSPDAPPAAA